MTVIVTPSGSPTIIYSQEGVTIDTLASAGSNQGSAASIVRYSYRTVVSVDATAGSSSGVILPANAEVGDVVELHASDTCLLYPNSGAAIDPPTRATNAAAVIGNNAGFTVRFMPDSNWYRISQ